MSTLAFGTGVFGRDRYVFDPSGDLCLILVDSENSASIVKDEVNSTKISNGIRMFASSKHLMLASHVFKAMLQSGQFREGATLAIQKQVEIPLPDDDAAALEIVLNIIHGRTRSVPKTVDLKLLTKLAVLVDKYQLHEPVEVFSDQWFQNIKHSMSKNFDSELCSWLCIAWVFKKPSEYLTLTKIAQMGCSGSLRGPETDHLPIPAKTLDEIQNYRVAAISEASNEMQRLLALYRRGMFLQCKADVASRYLTADHSMECDAMMLGRLEKIAIDAGIEPRPASYDGIVWSTLRHKLTHFELRSLCHRIQYPLDKDPSYSSRVTPTSHGVKERLELCVRSCEEIYLTGLFLYRGPIGPDLVTVLANKKQQLQLKLEPGAVLGLPPRS